jgi:ABC-2 type transport system ATP-binding protein
MPDSNDIAIKVTHLSKDFKLPHESQNSLKGRLINFHKRGYETQHALRDVSFEVKKGEFFGIVGKNGSGKSTLLKILAGIYAPNKGSVSINGSLTPFIELGVGFNPELSGRDNVYLNGALLGFSRKEMDAMYSDIVDFAELERFMDQKLKNYSSGMQVRLAFSVAIRAKSDILLLDEVLAVGDARFQQKCCDYFYTLKKEGKTVVFISHDMAAVQKFCDRAIFIKNGNIEGSGRPVDIANDYLVELFDKNTGESANELNTPAVKDFSIELPDKKKYVRQDKAKVTFNVRLTQDYNAQLRVAIIKEGMAIAHINSNSLPLDLAKGKHTISFSLSLDNFLSGNHEVSGGLYSAETGEQIAFAHAKNHIFVTEEDTNRSGLFRIDGIWKKEA